MKKQEKGKKTELNLEKKWQKLKESQNNKP